MRTVIVLAQQEGWVLVGAERWRHTALNMVGPGVPAVIGM